jgi:hypothetical protein
VDFHLEHGLRLHTEPEHKGTLDFASLPRPFEEQRSAAALPEGANEEGFLALGLLDDMRVMPRGTLSSARSSFRLITIRACPPRKSAGLFLFSVHQLGPRDRVHSRASLCASAI